MNPKIALLVALPCLLAFSLRPAAAPAPQPASPTRPTAAQHDVMESAFCARCHPAIYAEHEQSTHGRAFTDEEARLATARFEIDGCIACHTPRPIFETGVGMNPIRRFHGLEEGNTCMTCHWRPDYDYAAFQGGPDCRGAFHEDVGTVEACASCHRNHGTPYQWEKSPTGRASGRECVDCHMETALRPVAVGGPVREVRRHVFPGSRSEAQVGRAYRYRAEIEEGAAVVRITNRGAGHNFPTELKQRSVESLLVVRDAAGNEVARSRRVFRDPYKRPYGLELPVNTQIPGGETREHRIALPVADGTVEATLFYKLYYPIEDYHPELSRVLEARVLPFAGVDPSEELVEPEPDVHVVTPENIAPETASPGNLVDFARPAIGAVEVEIPEGDSPEDIARYIELFQFPVGEANRIARARLAAIGLPAVDALVEALGSWDNKTWMQAQTVLGHIGDAARPALVAAMSSDELYVRLHARELVASEGWRGEEVAAALGSALAAEQPLDRASAAQAIGRLGLGAHAPALRELVADGDPDVVRAAAQALAALGDREARPALEAALARAFWAETRRDLAVALAQLGSDAGVRVLLEGLDHPDDLLREDFFEALFLVTGEHRGYDPLAPRPERLAALAELQAWWAKDGGPARLLPPDPERDLDVEERALKLVHELGGTGFTTASGEEDAALEEELVALGRAAVPAVVQGLAYPPGFSAKRASLCKVLGRIGDPRAVPALAAALRDPVVSTAAWAAWALQRFDDRQVQPALRRYEERLRRLIATDAIPASAGAGDVLLAQAACARLAAGDADARATLASLLLSGDVTARRLAIDALRADGGDARGYDPDAAEAERRAAATNWME